MPGRHCVYVYCHRYVKWGTFDGVTGHIVSKHSILAWVFRIGCYLALFALGLGDSRRAAHASQRMINLHSCFSSFRTFITNSCVIHRNTNQQTVRGSDGAEQVCAGEVGWGSGLGRSGELRVFVAVIYHVSGTAMPTLHLHVVVFRGGDV